MLNVWYPVTYDIERPQRYNRWTVLFRLILAIPQLLLFGGFSLFFGRFGANRVADRFQGGSTGPLAAALELLAVFAWFYIIFTGRYPTFRGFVIFLFRWSQNVSAYMALLADRYPPFSDGPYPLRIGIQPDEEHNRWTVGFRLILAVPHYIGLFFLGIAVFVVTIIAWFAILITGEYPEGMYNFSAGVARWGARVGGYLLLLVDEYPPFSLEGGAGPALAEQPDPLEPPPSTYEPPSFEPPGSV